MHPTRNKHTPLSPSAERAYEFLKSVVEGNEDGIPTTAARSELTSADGVSNCLPELLEKGYLYEVSGTLYVT
ncbi:hypothetical protein ACFQJC_07435 [Haloferax namakaokahaiae]|uniref:Uncharacterized protein n=1 Tax=Haloferax namakaokahaiae TaxID=1748331 RepID=A0ABD5ZDR4_9EURY